MTMTAITRVLFKQTLRPGYLAPFSGRLLAAAMLLPKVEQCNHMLEGSGHFIQ